MKVFCPFPCWMSLSNGSVTVLYLSNVTCCLYQTVAKIRTYTQLPSVRGMITILEPLPVKENIYTAVISEMNDNNIRTTSCKREHIYTAVISKRNDNNMRTTPVKENMYTQLSSVRGMITI
jgi:hypothetical protein